MLRVHWSLWMLAAVGLGLLLARHWVHAVGVVPYLILLACPLLHLIHRGHGEHRRSPVRRSRAGDGQGE